jgi:hypothetical protein
MRLSVASVEMTIFGEEKSALFTVNSFGPDDEIVRVEKRALFTVDSFG